MLHWHPIFEAWVHELALALGFAATGIHLSCTHCCQLAFPLLPRALGVWGCPIAASLQQSPQAPDSTGIWTLHTARASPSPLASSASGQLCAFTSCGFHRFPGSIFQMSGSLVPFPYGLWASPGPPPRFLTCDQWQLSSARPRTTCVLHPEVVHGSQPHTSRSLSIDRLRQLGLFKSRRQEFFFSDIKNRKQYYDGGSEVSVWFHNGWFKIGTVTWGDN